jgi:hypothetical protein
MKKTLLLATLIISSMFFYSCSTSYNDQITLDNQSSSDISFNFRGEVVSAAAGSTVYIKEVPQGTYDYSTSYSLPAGATSSTTEGNFQGNVTMNAGTKILFLFSSTLNSGSYTIYVTESNSDDQSSSTSP